MLVAPAALGLFSPLAANATEVNLNDMSNYSDVESIDFTNFFALGSGILKSLSSTFLKLIQMLENIGNNIIENTKKTDGNIKR